MAAVHDSLTPLGSLSVLMLSPDLPKMDERAGIEGVEDT